MTNLKLLVKTVLVGLLATPLFANAGSMKAICDAAIAGKSITIHGNTFTCDSVVGAHEANRNVLAVCEESAHPTRGGYHIEVSDWTNPDIRMGRYLSISRYGIAPDTAPAAASDLECQ